MMSLELKFKQTSTCKNDKVKFLTLLPKAFSRKHIIDQFGVSKRMVDASRNLGFLESPPCHRGRPFSVEIINLVLQIYQDDEFSRLLPGMKDCKSIVHGKEKKQKRLLMLTVAELYQVFKERYRDRDDIKIGISKFFSLRPKWCITAGASGSHSVCCCTIHENVKLLCDCLDPGTTYKSLVSLAVCDTDNSKCMLLKCDDCPKKSAIKTHLLSHFIDDVEEYDNSDESESVMVTFKQWVAVDRTDLITQTLPVTEFVDLVLVKLYKLIPHSFIARKQGQYFKERKVSMKVGEVLCSMDFSENYQFVIQDEASRLSLDEQNVHRASSCMLFQKEN